MNKKLRVYSTSISLVLAFLIIFLASVIISRNVNYRKTEDEKILGYKLDNTVKYDVKTNKSDYFEDISGKEDIISSLIDKINIKFNYKLDANDNINTKTKYVVSSRLIVDYIKDITRTNLLDEKKDIITKTIDNHTGTIKIEENIVSDYNYYNEYVKKFKATYPLSGLDAKIVYTFKVDTNGSYLNSDLDDSSESSITITLLNSMTNISTSSINNIDKGIYISKELPFIKSYVNLILGIIVLFIGVFFLIPLFMAIKLVTKNNEFRRTIKSYLKIYDDVIVEASKQVEIDKEVVEVKSFYELLDAYQELHIPVVFYEVVPNHEGWFTITTDTQIWRFILKNKKLS